MIGLPTVTSVLLALLVNVTAFQAAAAEDKSASRGQGPPYAERGVKTCMQCHDKPPVTLILHTAHAQSADPRTPFAAHACEACHGPSPEHLKKPPKGEERAPVKVMFGRNSVTPVAEQIKVCLGCHEAGPRMNWKGSQHQFADISCASCHTLHTLKDEVLLKASQPKVCFTCHATQRAQIYLFSSHPIKEGKVVCADCHNAHGSFGPQLLVKGTVNETCYQCHPETRGPFLWEHAPVREDCGNCHAPHGSTQPRLLKVRTPWLCQMCHMEAFHPSTVYSGTGVPPRGVADRLLVKGCLNCHSQVHGSNHPSGVRLMR